MNPVKKVADLAKQIYAPSLIGFRVSESNREVVQVLVTHFRAFE